MQLLKPAEVATILAVSESALEAWRAQGKGPPWHRIEGRIRYDEERVREYVRERAAGGDAGGSRA